MTDSRCSWVTNSSYLSLWEACLGNKGIKPVSQYLQAASTRRRLSWTSAVERSQCVKIPWRRTLGSRPPSCKVSADSFPVHSAARQQPPESLIRHRNAVEDTLQTILLGTRQESRILSPHSPPQLRMVNSHTFMTGRFVGFPSGFRRR